MRVLVGLLVLAGLVGTSACGTFTMGAAAIVGGQRIDVDSVDQTAQKVVRIDPTAQQKTNVIAGIVSMRVLDLLLVELAHREGVSWTRGDVDSAIDKATRGQGVQSGEVYTIGLINQTKVEVPANAAKDYGRDLYIISVLIQRYGGASSPKAQQKLVNELTAVADDVGVRVNPRYGSFDPKNLTLRTDKNALWTPAKGAATGP
ncbi:MAG: hypothetical protein ACRDMV_11150 [Streptosporangiales bacterium]